MAYYERAASLNPSDVDVLANLAMTQSGSRHITIRRRGSDRAALTYWPNQRDQRLPGGTMYSRVCLPKKVIVCAPCERKS